MPRTLSRKQFLRAAALLGATLLPLPQAWADAYPPDPSSWSCPSPLAAIPMCWRAWWRRACPNRWASP